MGSSRGSKSILRTRGKHARPLEADVLAFWIPRAAEAETFWTVFQVPGTFVLTLPWLSGAGIGYFMG
eukprot:7645796-Pyramimonas_sp.AAC.1